MNLAIVRFLFLAWMLPGVVGLVEGAGGGLDSISKSDLMRHIKHLADDKLEGRESGGPGNTPATEYVAAEFRRYGLKPISPTGDFLQPFEISLNAEFGGDTHFEIVTADGTQRMELGKDYLPFDNIDKGVATGAVVFVGYGITAQKEGYDDYAGLNVSNKVVLMLRKAPRDGKTNGLFRATAVRPNQHALFTTKLENAKRHGAKGILIVDASSKPQTMKQMSDGGPFRIGPQKNSLPFAFVSQVVASNWFSGIDRKLKETVEQIDNNEKPFSFALPKLSVDLKIQIKREKATVSNVIGLLEGSDPKVKDEYLVIGGHLDHVGYGRDRRNRGKSEFIHNGADDNASGTSAVLELAQAFAGLEEKPRRSILFMGFNAEERGLLGSRHYVDKPFIPLTNTIAMINLDMVGRGASGLDVGGVGTSPGFAEMVKSAATNFSFKLTLNPGGKAPSDNTSFYNKNLPVLFFYTGKHDDYHKPTDDWQKIDQAEIEKVTQMAFSIARQMADAPVRPKFTKSDGNPARRGRPRVLLGVVLQSDYAGKGVKVQEVMDNSPAAKAGLRPGDIIEKLGGKEVVGMPDITRFLALQRKGARSKVSIRRGKTVSILNLEF